MFALVHDVAAYPEFLPWCRASKVLESRSEHMRASLELARGGVAKWFTTANRLVPGRSIVMELESGPFKEIGRASCRERV